MTVASPLASLSRRVGNRAFGALVQAKLAISEPGDVFEREADRIADAFVRTIPGLDPGSAGAATVDPAATVDTPVETIRGVAAPSAEDRPVSPDLQGSIDRARATGGTTLPHVLRTSFERRFGTGFGDVRVHTGPAASESARALNALAYTVGSDIVFREGQFSPTTREGQKLLAHELTHVIQQRQGGVQKDDGTVAVFREAAPQRDWRRQNEAEYQRIVTRIRALQDRAQGLAKVRRWNTAQGQEFKGIQDEIVTLVQSLRKIGVTRPPADIFTLLLETPPKDLRQITGTVEDHGTDQKTILWGERRGFTLTLDFLPENVDVQVSWWFDPGTGQLEGVADPMFASVFQSYAIGREMKLDESFWPYWDRFGPSGNKQAGKPPGFSIAATVVVGGDHANPFTFRTPWLDLKEALPATLTLDAPRIITLPSVTPPTTGTVQPATSTTTPTANTQAAGSAFAAGVVQTTDYVLQGATIEFQLSWVPPVNDPRRKSYAVAWSITDETTKQKLYFNFAPFGGQVYFWRTSYVFPKPGPFTFRTDIHSLPFVDPNATPLVSAVRPLQCISSDDLAKLVLDRYTQQKTANDYRTQASDLDKQLADAKETLAAGSLDPGALDDQIDRLKDARGKMRDQIGDPATTLPFPEKDSNFDRHNVYVTPLPAVFAHPDFGSAYPLSLFLKLSCHQGVWTARLTDATTQDVIGWEGGARDNPWLATNRAIAEWRKGNEYPQGGFIHYRFDKYGWNFVDKFSTNSLKKDFWEWFDLILFAAQAIVAVALLLTPEPTGATKAAGIALLTIGILRSTYNIYRNFDLGRPLLDQRNVLEAVSIVAGFLGLRGGTVMFKAAGTVAKGELLAGQALKTFRVGQGFVLTATALDVGTFVYVSNQALGQLEAASRDPTIPASQREAMLMKVMAQLAAQGLLIIGTNTQLFSGRRPTGTRELGLVDKLVGQTGEKFTLDPATRTRVEGELRDMKVERDLSALTDQQLFERYLSVGTEKAAAARLDEMRSGLSEEARAQFEKARSAHKTAAEFLKEVESRADGSEYFEKVVAERKAEIKAFEDNVTEAIEDLKDPSPTPGPHSWELIPPQEKVPPVSYDEFMNKVKSVDLKPLKKDKVASDRYNRQWEAYLERKKGKHRLFKNKSDYIKFRYGQESQQISKEFIRGFFENAGGMQSFGSIAGTVAEKIWAEQLVTTEKNELRFEVIFEDPLNDNKTTIVYVEPDFMPTATKDASGKYKTASSPGEALLIADSKYTFDENKKVPLTDQVKALLVLAKENGKPFVFLVKEGGDVAPIVKEFAEKIGLKWGVDVFVTRDVTGRIR